MLSRKQKWRKAPISKANSFSYEEHHANDYQRKSNKLTHDENSCSSDRSKLYGYSDDIKLLSNNTKTWTSSKDLKSPLKSCLSSNSLFTLGNDDSNSSVYSKPRPSPSKTALKKKIKFSLVIKVCLIHGRKEISHLYSELYWTPQDCDRFKKEAFAEIMKCKQKHTCTAKEAILMLYQPGDDTIILDVLEMIAAASAAAAAGLVVNTPNNSTKEDQQQQQQQLVNNPQQATSPQPQHQHHGHHSQHASPSLTEQQPAIQTEEKVSIKQEGVEGVLQTSSSSSSETFTSSRSSGDKSLNNQDNSNSINTTADEIVTTATSSTNTTSRSSSVSTSPRDDNNSSSSGTNNNILPNDNTSTNSNIVVVNLSDINTHSSHNTSQTGGYSSIEEMDIEEMSLINAALHIGKTDVEMNSIVIPIMMSNCNSNDNKNNNNGDNYNNSLNNNSNSSLSLRTRNNSNNGSSGSIDGNNSNSNTNMQQHNNHHYLSSSPSPSSSSYLSSSPNTRYNLSSTLSSSLQQQQQQTTVIHQLQKSNNSNQLRPWEVVWRASTAPTSAASVATSSSHSNTTVVK